jgi:recyclin-1
MQIADEANDFESAIRGNVIRENDKTNFLASFKKAILLPVSVIPTLPFPGSHSRSATLGGKTSTSSQSTTPARPSTPSAWDDTTPARHSLPAVLPTTELAAQAAILNSRLERIKTLFSIEVALQLVHTGREALERMKSFKHLQGEIGDKVYVLHLSMLKYSRQSCEAVFIILLTALGQRHIQPGFEQALEHLSQYKPYKKSEGEGTVEPLLTFLELVHIGDLIQQMVDVFFNQEVVRLQK